jgi:radical SAM protein with 4Fe4S-binding SPASM domain
MSFSTNPNTYNFQKNLNDLQKKRLNDHKASVTVDEEGQFQVHSEQIITPKGLSKVNKRISVLPDPNETVVKMSEAKYLFRDLQQMNVILTNACNLSCSYCYEQHNKDFGRFTNESLLESYNFLLNSSDHEKKIFQFFGGEPLIHKDLILGFLKEHKDYLEANSKGWTKQYISCVTNGLLITPDFMNEYFEYDFTFMLISLDTIRAEVDHREIGQKKINALLKTIKNIPQKAKDTERVTMRCTLAKENAPYFREFVDAIYDAGVKHIVVHPLILDSSRGFIAWSEKEWNTLHQDILDVLDEYHDLAIHFSEGVGQKGENNCMVGSDMIAIDGSGDYSGCYFFTNQKAGPAGKTILGNVFDDKLYLDRYKGFQKAFTQMVEEEEQCKTCDYKNACYQCPAGNMDTGHKLFRPDDMCQKIVKLYVDLQDDIEIKHFQKKFTQIMQACENEGEDKIYTRATLHLMFKMFSDFHAFRDDTEWGWKEIPSPEQLYAAWTKMIEQKYVLEKPDFKKFMQDLKKYVSDDAMSVKELYEWICRKAAIPTDLSEQITSLDYAARISYCVFLHFLILHNQRAIRSSNFESVKDKLLNS